MQPLAFTAALAEIHRDEQIDAARASRVASPPARRLGEVTIRPARPADASDLARLAVLDGHGAAVGGDALVAVVGGDVVAARDPRGGVVSDPFRAGGDLIALLEVRARQLAGGRFSRTPRARREPRRSMPVLRVGGAR